MATLGPGQAALFIGPAPDCKVEHSPHRNSLCLILAIEAERVGSEGHVILCRAQDGTEGYARADELRAIDDWGVDQEARKEEPATSTAWRGPN